MKVHKEYNLDGYDEIYKPQARNSFHSWDNSDYVEYIYVH